MLRISARIALLCAAAAQPIVAMPLTAQTPTTGLKAGVARVDITPPLADLPAPFKIIHDHIYVRAVVLDDGHARALIVVADVPTIGNGVYETLKERLAKVTGATPEHSMLAVTHSHNAVRLDPNPVGISIPGSAKITAATIEAMVAAVRQAASNLQPARAGFATGINNLVTDRGMGRSNEPAEAADRTVGVLRIETTAGEPLALLVNSSLEPVLGLAAPAEINSDIAGATERYVEQHYGDKPVVLYTVSAPAASLYSARRQGGVPAADPNVLIAAMGTLLGEEVLATSARIKSTTDVDVGGALLAIDCPGKLTTPLNLPNQCSDAPGATLPPCVFQDHDTAPVTLRVGLLKIGGVNIIQADANVTAPVWQRLKAEAPANTMLVSLFYGPLHYVVDDGVYQINSYQATATTARRGCAAQGFINTSLKLIGAPAAAPVHTTAVVPVPVSPAEKALLAIERRRFDAQEHADVDTLSALIADDAVYVHANGTTQTKREYLSDVASGKSRYKSIRAGETSATIRSSVAVTHGIYTLAFGDGKSLVARYTGIYVKHGATWLVQSWQSTPVMPPR